MIIALVLTRFLVENKSATHVPSFGANCETYPLFHFLNAFFRHSSCNINLNSEQTLTLTVSANLSLDKVICFERSSSGIEIQDYVSRRG